MPGAKPVTGIDFKGEPVYLRKQTSELHTCERWLKQRREVIPGERPIKAVQGMYNDPHRVAELYGYWQTRAFKLQLTEDGHIPRNAHGNIEMFNGPLPEECCFMDVPRSKTLCNKLGIEFVQAMWGFEKKGGGFSVPVTKGVVVFKQDAEKLQEAADEWEK